MITGQHVSYTNPRGGWISGGLVDGYYREGHHLTEQVSGVVVAYTEAQIIIQANDGRFFFAQPYAVRAVDQAAAS